MVRGFGEIVSASTHSSTRRAASPARRASAAAAETRASARASRAALAGADDAHVPLRSRSTSAFPVSNARDAAADA